VDDVEGHEELDDGDLDLDEQIDEVLGGTPKGAEIWAALRLRLRVKSEEEPSLTHVSRRTLIVA